MADDTILASKLANAEAHFRKLADRMRDLHGEALHQEERIEREREKFAGEMHAKDQEIETAEDEVREHVDLIDRLRDVQQGIRTLDEVLDDWDRSHNVS
jgi:predicted  nucleic acid-binding Zn-ribbon protein